LVKETYLLEAHILLFFQRNRGNIGKWIGDFTLFNTYGISFILSIQVGKQVNE